MRLEDTSVQQALALLNYLVLVKFESGLPLDEILFYDINYYTMKAAIAVIEESQDEEAKQRVRDLKSKHVSDDVEQTIDRYRREDSLYSTSRHVDYMTRVACFPFASRHLRGET